jgi:hypothetical protein
MAGIDSSKIQRDTRFIYEKLVERQRTGFQDPDFFARVDAFISEGKKSLCVSVSFDPIFGLRDICQELERRSFGITSPV